MLASGIRRIFVLARASRQRIHGVRTSSRAAVDERGNGPARKRCHDQHHREGHQPCGQPRTDPNAGMVVREADRPIRRDAGDEQRHQTRENQAKKSGCEFCCACWLCSFRDNSVACDATAGTFLVAGSGVPLAVIMAIFFAKYLYSHARVRCSRHLHNSVRRWPVGCLWLAQRLLRGKGFELDQPDPKGPTLGLNTAFAGTEPLPRPLGSGAERLLL